MSFVKKDPKLEFKTPNIPKASEVAKAVLHRYHMIMEHPFVQKCVSEKFRNVYIIHLQVVTSQELCPDIVKSHSDLDLLVSYELADGTCIWSHVLHYIESEDQWYFAPGEDVLTHIQYFTDAVSKHIQRQIYLMRITAGRETQQVSGVGELMYGCPQTV